MRLSPILLWILGLVSLGGSSARAVGGSIGSRSSLKMGNSARTSPSKNQNTAFIQEKQVRDMIMRQIELLTNKRHLLPKSRLKRAHFGRIHKRNARRRNGMGSLKSDDRNRNRAEKDRKEKDRNKGERNHKVQSKYKKNHSKRRSLKRRNLNEKKNRLQLHRISSSRLRQNRDQAKRHLREQNAMAIANGRNGRNSGRGCFSNGLSMLDDLGNFNCNQVPSFVRTGK